MRLSSSSFLAFLFVGAMILGGCNKTQDDPVPQIPGPDPDTDPQGLVVAGDPTNMLLVQYGEDVQPNTMPNGSIEFPLDLDQDGVADIAIHIVSTHALGTGVQARTWLQTLHPNAHLLGDLVTRVFQYRIDTLSIAMNANGQLQIDLVERKGCDLGPDAVDMAVFDQFDLRPYAENDTLFLGQDNPTDTVTLRRSPYMAYAGGVIYYSPDTLITLQDNRLRNCTQIPMQQPMYIAILLEDGQGVQRLGWIHLELLNYWKIHLFETALEN